MRKIADNMEAFDQFLKAAEATGGYNTTALLNLKNDTNEELVLSILTEYSGTLRESLKKLSELNLETGGPEFYKICHKLKGSSDLLGFAPLTLRCKQIQEMKSHATNERVDKALVQEIVGMVETVQKAVAVI